VVEDVMKTFDEERRRMVEKQIAARGVVDRRVLDAMRAVPREVFVPAPAAEFAYEDRPLAIEEGQTISQPYVVALMAAALQLTPRDRVLEIGAGSGYAAAVLSRVAAEVYAVERHTALAELARRRMRELGYDNVHILHGDGTLGCVAHAPYDAIVVAAGGPSIPEALRVQLVIGGRLVIPVGLTPHEQELVRVTRTGEKDYEQEGLGDVRFVPLIGAQGWEEGAGAREAVAPGA
jgi:protein-L-isoaspartate(D-aspartate) O-methyltransferase